MSTLQKPPPLPQRTPSSLSIPVLIPVEKAIETLNTAAKDLKDDAVSFATVLDLHASTAFNRYDFADQDKFLQAIEVLFKENSDLASDIAWDAIPVLLKFAARQVDRIESDSENQKAVVVRANLLLDYCATNGNSKEVFLIVAGKIKSLDFRKVDEDSDSEDTEDEDEDEDFTPKQKVSQAALSTAKILLRLQALVQTRLKMKAPSKFLATSLMSLLSMIAKASKSLPIGPLCDIMNQIVGFVLSVTPKLEDSSSDSDIPIQVKLIQAFITHGIEAFLTLPPDNATMAGWSSAWDRTVRPEKVVPKNIITESSSHAHPVSSPNNQPDDSQTKLAVAEVIVAFLSLSDTVGMNVETLLKICLESKLDEEEEPEFAEEPGSPTAPTSAEEIPLSYVGALLLFAGSLSIMVLKGDDTSSLTFKIFPEHAALSEKFLPESVEAPVIDAMVFIGSWIVRKGNKDGDISELGTLPSKEDDLFLYLQKYSAISATSSEPELRALSFLHATTILHINPRQDIRLAFIKDTLEHCPFEALKAAIIGYLKDEIVAALKLKTSDQSEHSIFLSPVILDSLLLSLFPDYEDEILKAPIQEGWARFNEAYSTISATANLYYLMWANDDLRNYLGVTKPDWIAEIQRRWLDVIRKSLSTFKAVSQGEGSDGAEMKKEIQSSTMDLEMLVYLLDRLDEVRQQKSS